MTMDINDMQAALWENKKAKGFNLTDVPLEFCLLTAEVSEAFEAWRKNPAGLGSELADVVLFAAGLAQMNGVDLDQAVRDKLAVNAAREYVIGPAGVPVRVKEGSR